MRMPVRAVDALDAIGHTYDGFKPTTTSTMNSVTTPKDDVKHTYDGFKPTSSSTMNSVTTPKDNVTHVC